MQRNSNNDTRKKSKGSLKNNTGTGHANTKDYLFSMSLAPRISDDTHWVQLIPSVFFSAFIIMIVRLAAYNRPMDQFYWGGSENQLSDFFSYYKMIAILVCTVLVLVLLLYRLLTQSLYVKRSFAYIPMGIYSIFVLVSYLASSYKEFALWGWNDRFEGTLVLVSYMVMLFFIINTINTEKNVKYIIYSIAVTSTILGILGVTQALGHDFLQTTLGKKLITPSWFWNQLDNLEFNFTHKEIYQTVYNINYVSFYLTLLIPLFGLIFVQTVMEGKAAPLWKKVIWGVIFGLLLYNLIGSASSGGLLGIGFSVLVAVILLNKKLIQWWRAVLILLAITAAVSVVTYGQWFPELRNSVQGVLGTQPEIKKEAVNDTSAVQKHKIDFIETKGDTITMSYAGNEIIFTTFPDNPLMLQADEPNGNHLAFVPADVSSINKIDDTRFDGLTVSTLENEGNHFIVIYTDGFEWPFVLTESGVKYLSNLGKPVDLDKIPAIGWENNLDFGSGRGYIWSRTLPMMKSTVLLGHGADTYCIYFPHNDYVGKYNSYYFSKNLNLIVDKPHDMYMGYFIGTGGISLLALLTLFGWYLVQSIRIFRKKEFQDFISYAGAGIFLGICGFLAAALVNDSSVSVMPMFYGLLGTGIAINMILKKKGTKAL